MKKQISIDVANRLINCGMVILVTSSFEGKNNITTCAWHMPVSKQPPIVAVGLAKKHLSSEYINKTKEFIINVPTWQLLDKVKICGTMSGRKIDKYSQAGFTSCKPIGLKNTYKISECAGDLECRLIEAKEAGDHFIFLGEVVSAQVEAEYFINDFWNTNKIDFIFHLGGNYFFKSASYIEHK